jgi:uncharacterized glyoxalase superfamily protein PhnB
MTNDFQAKVGHRFTFRTDPAIEEQPWGTFTTFEDPDGNGWVLSQAPQRR